MPAQGRACAARVNEDGVLADAILRFFAQPVPGDEMLVAVRKLEELEKKP